MRVRSMISKAMATPVLRAYKARVSHGSLLSIPMPVWRAIPKQAKNWLGYRVLDPGEAFAWEVVTSHPVLGGLAIDRENSWAISPSTMLFLWELLLVRKPQRILEFGSGISTQIFSAYAETIREDGKVKRIVSVDHDAAWLDKTRERLTSTGRNECVELVHGELVEQSLLGRKMLAYDVPQEDLADAASDEGFDLCFIDGPPGTVGRSGCLPLAVPYLARGAIVLLDDAYRPGEQTTLHEWNHTYKQDLAKPRMLLADGHGLAITSWNGKRAESSDTVRNMATSQI